MYIQGFSNANTQLRAVFSPSGKHIMCGSEDKLIYLWRTKFAKICENNPNNFFIQGNQIINKLQC